MSIQFLLLGLLPVIFLSGCVGQSTVNTTLPTNMTTTNVTNQTTTMTTSSPTPITTTTTTTPTVVYSGGGGSSSPAPSQPQGQTYQVTALQEISMADTQIKSRTVQVSVTQGVGVVE